MKYAIQSVRNRDAGAQDRINVYLAGISNTTISVCQTAVMCLGKINVASTFELELLLIVAVYHTTQTLRGW